MEVALNIIINKILMTAAKRRASHVHLTVGSYPVLRIDDGLIELGEEKIITNSFINQLAEAWLTADQKKELAEKKELIFAKEVEKNFRLRINFFYQKNFISASLHLIPGQIPNLINLGLPKSVYSLTDRNAGLIVICGPYGSGRTTTAAAMLEEINKNRKVDILTIEQPIEYLLVNKESIIEQREVGHDVNSFTDALNYAKRSDVNVLFVDSTSESSVLPLALEFATSGRLVIMIMDTTSVIQTIEEMIAGFEEGEKNRAQNLLSDSLLAIISQRLVPRVGGGLILATESLIATDSVRSLIKEGRIQQLATVMQSSRAEGMTSLDQSLAELVKSGDVLIDKAVEYSEDPKGFRTIVRT
jgi:twitching motility protein PilT